MLSVITPAFNEAGNLQALHDRLASVLKREGIDWEWIIIDDHSSDGTSQAIETLAARDRRVRGLRFARTQGSDAAILCGLDEARGDAVVLVAADLQDPPETIPALLDRWKRGARIVWAVHRRRSDRPNDAIARIHDLVRRRIVGWDRDMDAGFFVIDRHVADTVRQFQDRHASVFALLAWLGFPQEAVEYQPPAGTSRTSVATIDSLSKLVTTFSDMPLRVGIAAGLAVLGVGIVCGLLAFLGVEVGPLSPGWMLLLSGILIVGGLNLTLLGVIGEYLWRVLEESRRRPRYIVERRIEGLDALAAGPPSPGTMVR